MHKYFYLATIAIDLEGLVCNERANSFSYPNMILLLASENVKLGSDHKQGYGEKLKTKTGLSFSVSKTNKETNL